MCNLYRMTNTVSEIARWFDAVDAVGGANFAAEVYPGYTGLVVAEGRVRPMTWGFPLQLTGKDGRKLKARPVTNARADKLHGPFWRDSFAHRRCLVPVTQWAEPRGAAGRMTRSWYSLPDRDLIAVAGLWRPSEQWGACYTMVMVDSSEHMAEVHDRMPVILDPATWLQWCTGSADDAMALVRTWPGPLVAEHTDRRWVDGEPLGEGSQLI